MKIEYDSDEDYFDIPNVHNGVVNHQSESQRITQA